MKILLVSQYFWPENFKGNEIASGLVLMGHEVTVLTAKPNYPEGTFYSGYSFWGHREESHEGVRIIRVPVLRRRNGEGLALVFNYLSFIFFSWFAVHFRLRGSYDVVFIQQLSPVTMAIPGIWAKRKFRCPAIMWVLDLWPESVTAASGFSNKTVLKLLDRMVRWIYNHVDRILISSNFFKESIRVRLADNRKEIIYFPNWAEEVFTNPPRSGLPLPELPDGFKIMFAGNIGEAQDFDTLVEVFTLAKDDDIQWIIAGEGRKSKWLKNEIQSRNLTKVNLIGRLPIEAMPELFKQADAMIVSLRDEDIFSLTVPAKIQAYQASGKVILGCLNGEGNAIINTSGCGYAVGAGDFQGFYNLVLRIKSMTIRDRKMMEAKSRTYYNIHFDKEILFRKLEQLLIQTLSEGSLSGNLNNEKSI